jgi:hypothetical protein
MTLGLATSVRVLLDVTEYHHDVGACYIGESAFGCN